MMHVVGVPDGI